ncbi:hypothetical protein C3L23_07965 [Nautilia sp. PV-1]|uniref:hypothetical protein n=1 Tax=Nautilia sp. PV-1 TaxID=2579250 RepID=UPI000FD7812F|nr:hypothetical protein [Nautilia sp. PV-1]AZV47210.1 hypothetical protein C3L23_07965 [Nautilia sp. PV-1]
MKYILTFILIIFIAGCSKNTKPAENHQNIETNQSQQKKPQKENDIIKITFDNFTLKFKENKLIYPKTKTVILFDNNSSYSKAQELVLKKLNVKYYKTDSAYLEKYFNIQYYPTIIVLDKNKTVKYENFTPYEILKAEGF